MPVLRNIGRLARCCFSGLQGDIHPLERAALVWQGETLEWVGSEADLPSRFQSLESWDAKGRLVIPGLIDCHTHLAFAGWRAEEFTRRNLGAGYLEVAGKGGGILHTVELTRRASAEELLERCLRFLKEIGSLGVTTVECKSGYGLDCETELKLLDVYRKLSRRQSIRIVSTLLGAHVFPPEFQQDRQGYLSLLCEELIPEVAGRKLASFCDVFQEKTAFSRNEARTVLEAGKAFGLAPKIHADQLSNGEGAVLAAETAAVSADHLEQVSDQGIEAMAAADVVAVSLPLASLFLHQPALPARKLIERGVPLAVATDFNPGSAPSFHLPLAMTLACLRQAMTPAEVLKGATIYAAKAVGLQRRIGSLEPGKSADFALIDAPDVDHWLYHFRANACKYAVARGRRLEG